MTDWRRDLTTNVAETSPDAVDSLLRPLPVSAPLEEATALVIGAVQNLPRWALVSRTDGQDGVRLAFTRTTRLFRFVDDVTVWIDDRGDDRLIRARSASRVGSADLGQNPRNLRELFTAVRASTPVGRD
ncbi:MAG: DUF1499 domain-containing protein [Gemmatimonadota bacterium]|nr:DUF1499 domain-containing protein [Gemmatimonadota bacterium]